jgi:hypothetical protein
MALSGFPTINFAASLRNIQSNAGSQRTAMAIPRTKFSFVIELHVNPYALTSLSSQTTVNQYIQNGFIYGQLRSIDHPRVRFETETLRSYNRYRKIYKKMMYEPATIAWHDDSTSMIQAVAKEYINFYSETGNIGTYGSSQGVIYDDGQFNIEQGIVGSNVRYGMNIRQSLGLKIRPQYMRHFFDSITIYDLGSEPTRINIHTFHRPVITSFGHDNLDWSSAELVSMAWVMEYEGYFVTVGQDVANFSDVMDNLLGGHGS